MNYAFPQSSLKTCNSKISMLWVKRYTDMLIPTLTSSCRLSFCPFLCRRELWERLDLAFSNPLNPTAHQSLKDPRIYHGGKHTTNRLVSREWHCCYIHRNTTHCSTSTANTHSQQCLPSILTTPVGTQHLKQQLRNFALGMLFYFLSCKASQEEWLKLARVEKRRNDSKVSQIKMDTISSSFISLADSVHSLAVAGSTEGFPGSKTK